MKRKLSLLMAAVMALSTVSFGAVEVQASTLNRVHGIPGTTVPNNTVFIERDTPVLRSGDTALASPSDIDAPFVTGPSGAGRNAGPSAGMVERFVNPIGNVVHGLVARPAGIANHEWRTANVPNNVGGGMVGVGYAVHAGYLELELQTNVRAGDMFRLDLENGEWLFRGTTAGVNELAEWATIVREADTGSGGYVGGLAWVPGNIPSASVSLTSADTVLHMMAMLMVAESDAGMALQNLQFFQRLGPDTLATTIADVGTESGENMPFGRADVGGVAAEEARRIVFNEWLDSWGVVDSIVRGGLSADLRGRIMEVMNRPLSAMSTQANLSVESHRIGGGMPVDGRNVPFTYNPLDGIFVTGTRGGEGTYLRFPGADRSSQRVLPYIMDISRVAENRSEGTVTLLTDGVRGDFIDVPLIIRVPTSDGATLRLMPQGHNPFVTQGVWHIAAAGPAATAAHVHEPVTARDRFEIERLVVRELRANSIRRFGGTAAGTNNNNEYNAFDIILNSGFYFDGDLSNVAMWLERDLTWGGLPGGAPEGVPGWGVLGVDFEIFFPEGYGNRRDRLRVQVRGWNESQIIAGSMSVEGLVVWAEESAPFDHEIEMRLVNTDWVGRGMGWTNEQRDWELRPNAAPVGWTRVGATNTATQTDWLFPMGTAERREYRYIRFDDALDTPREDAMIAAGWIQRMPTYHGYVNLSDIADLADYVVTRPAATAIVATANASARRFVPVSGWGMSMRPPQFGLRADSRNDSAMITEQTIRAGTRRDWGIVLRTEGAIPELISGRYEGPTSLPSNDHHRTARIVFEEVVPNSWWAGRQVVLSLPEEVRWRRVWFEEIWYPAGSHAGNITIAPNSIQRRHFYINNEKTAPAGERFGDHADFHAVGGTFSANRHGVHFNANRMYWTDVLARRDNARNVGAFIRFDAWVSIAAHFEGDIVLTASGSAVPHAIDSTERPAPSTVIATALPPVRVETEITNARIGFQQQQTANIVIRESRPGALMRDRQVRVSVTDLVATDILFSPNVNVEVTESNGLTIRNIGTGLAGSLYNADGVPTLGVEANRGTISFEVATVSHGAPATIVLSNVSVRVDRTVPETNEQPYWVIVWGNGIANNFGHYDTRPVSTGTLGREWPMWERTNLDRFPNYPGIFAEYLRVVTGGDGSPWLAQEVRVTIGELFYTVDGVDYDMDVAAILDPASESTFVPLRFIANAFGLQDDTNIVWDNHNRAVTLTLPTGRVVQFQVDSPIMLDNGVPRNIVNASGDAITPMMVVIAEDGGARMFLPFRFFGEVVLGVEVAWEAATQTAIFNPGGSSVE